MKLSNRLPILILFFIAQFTYFNSFSQPTRKTRCGSQYVLDELYKKNPGLKSEIAKERARLAQRSLQHSSLALRNNNTTLTVSVVVHVVLPVNFNSLITDASILSQIEVLNTDFAGLNPDSTRIPAAFKSRFAKSKIRFCLATKSPNGTATNGIVRVISNTKSLPGINDPIKYTDNGGSNAWDPQKYLNIWVGDTGSDFLGYTFTPSTPLSFIPLNERGIFNNYKYFGKNAPANPPSTPFNLGRTAVHEIGHFFNLVHIWGDTNCDGNDNCGDDDNIGDTPRQEACTTGDPTPFNGRPENTILFDNCTTTNPGIMWMNYMDYVDDKAMVMFSSQQQIEMEKCFIDIPWMRGLANSDACTIVPVFERDVRLVNINNPISSYNSAFLYACSNNYQPSIKVRNIGTNTVNSLRIESRINNGAPIITNWTGTILPNKEADILLNTIPISNGTNNNLSIVVVFVNGLADLNPSDNTFSAPGIILPVVLNLPLNEGFEQPVFPPLNWRLINPDNDITWAPTTAAAKSGTASMFFDNYSLDANVLYDWLLSPLLQARGKDSIFLSFQVAAATFRIPSTITDAYTDTLEILVSSDCGFNYTKRYNKAGLDLVTTGDIPFQDYFVPTASQWRRDSVFIGFYDNNAPEFIQIAFRNIANYENNIYIDDIRIYNRQRASSTPVYDEIFNNAGYVKVFPNPFRNQIIIEKSERFNNLPYRILNVFGQQIMYGYLKDQKQIIDASNLSSGLYFLQVKDNIIKLIKN